MLALVGSSYLLVQNLMNPSWCKNTLNGSMLVTNTYSLKSNLSPSIKSGFFKYFCTTHFCSSTLSISSQVRTR